MLRRLALGGRACRGLPSVPQPDTVRILSIKYYSNRSTFLLGKSTTFFLTREPRYVQPYMCAQTLPLSSPSARQPYVCTTFCFQRCPSASSIVCWGSSCTIIFCARLFATAFLPCVFVGYRTHTLVRRAFFRMLASALSRLQRRVPILEVKRVGQHSAGR